MKYIRRGLLLSILLSPLAVFAVEGEVYDQLSSSRGVKEICIATTKVPGAGKNYTEKDTEQERKFCNTNLHGDNNIALCPKTWSTSPGTMVYDLSESDFDKKFYQQSFHCGKKRKGVGVKTLAKFKTTMNQNNTSGTFSKSILLYYHFSRYFDTVVKVPVAVYKEVDLKAHLDIVAKKGLNKSPAGKIKNGWRHLVKAEQNTNYYSPASEFYSEGKQQIFGALVRGKGERYKTEFNGVRGGWGIQDNIDFQKTAPYWAIRSLKPLQEAINFGVAKAKHSSSTMRRDLNVVSDLQMVFWMREIIELTLMDYIFSQQDRIGNIDYQWYWYWEQDGKVDKKREKRDEYKDTPRKNMDSIPAPEDIAQLNPILVQRTNVNDNDAGGRYAYSNFAKKTNMLDNLRHYSADLYKKFIDLSKDLQSEGPIHQWVTSTFDLSKRQIEQIVRNTKLAAEKIQAQCNAGTMAFDLDVVENLSPRAFSLLK